MVYLNGLAQLLAQRSGFVAPGGRGEADSSAASTVGGTDPTPDRLASMGFGTRTEVVAE